MKISFLIVTRERPEDLAFSLTKLHDLIDLSIHEVCVFIDGCKATEAIIPNFTWVNWEIAAKSISASPAREKIYKKAKGTIIIGLDDDAHLISPNSIKIVEHLFEVNPKLGIIAFQEVKGLFPADEIALANTTTDAEAHFTNDFIGCGFALKNEAYKMTRGFPKWVDIYGEESCLSAEILQADFDILYYPEIVVNHRVDISKRNANRRNYFRFEKQLKNTFNYYLVYHPRPFFKIVKLMYHNFKKYALQDKLYFKLYFKVFFTTLVRSKSILNHRKPVSEATLKKMNNVKGLTY